MKPRMILVALCAAVVLNACGGGGRGVKPPEEPPPIPLVNGQCSATLNMCTAGSPNDITDSATQHLWQCTGSGGGTTASCQLPKQVEPQVCANGAAGAADPLLCKRGHLALPGIDRIPLNLVKLTNAQMQRHFVLVEKGTIDHGRNIRAVACKSYITGCTDPEDFSGVVRDANGTVTTKTGGSTPYTMLEDLDRNRYQEDTERDFLEQIRRIGSVKIVADAAANGGGWFVENAGTTLPFLYVNSAGNGASDDGWLTDQDPHAASVRVAIDANKALYAAGHDMVGGRYVRHQSSSGCNGPINDGCLWVPFQFDFHGDGSRVGNGTSLSSQALASSLASVLSVFPDTTHQNLAKFGKACAKKSGQGIEALLRSAGGVGVADFSCMGEVTTALANLPSGGSTTATINGSSVTVRGRGLSLPFADRSSHIPIASSEVWGLSFGVVPTGEGMVATVTKRQGNLFASLGGGMQEDFFGFSEEHSAVRTMEVSAGHDRAFARYSEQHSSGGGVIDSARGQSLGFTVRQHIALTEESVLSASAHADKFLGGSARIPVGTVSLEGGEWDYRLSLDVANHLSENTTIATSVSAHLPGGGNPEEVTVGVRFSQRF